MRKNLMRIIFSCILVFCFMATTPFAYSETVEGVCPDGKHTWGSWERIKDPTCTEQGEDQRKCTKCGEKESQYPEKLNHKWRTEANDGWEPDPQNPVSCKKDGKERRVCSRSGCNTVETRTITQLGHNFQNYYPSTDEPPTCEEGGYEVAVCTRCQTTDKRKVGKLGHDWGNWYTIDEPNCKEDGLEKHICFRCQKEETRKINTYGGKNQPRGHKFGEWSESRKPACNKKGLESRECSLCRRVENRETVYGKHVAKTGKTKDRKTFTWYANPQPSLERKGRKVQYCATCKKVIKSKEYAPDNYHYDMPVYGFGPMAGSVNPQLAGSLERLIPVDLTTPGESYYALVSQDGKLIGQMVVAFVDGTLSVNYRLSDPNTVVKQAMFYFYPSALSLTAQDLNDPTKAYQFAQALPTGGLMSCVISPRLIVNYDSDNPGNRLFPETGLYIDGTRNNAEILQEMTTQLIEGFTASPEQAAAPEAPLAPEAPAAPLVPEAPLAPEAPEAPLAPEVPEAPAAPLPPEAPAQNSVPVAPPPIVPVIPGN